MKRVSTFATLLAFVIPFLGSLPSRADGSLWTGSPAAETRTQTLLQALRAAADHGLEPAWYGVDEIEHALASGLERERLDRLVGQAFITYASDVSTGRVNANRIEKNIDIRQRHVEPADFLRDAAQANDFRLYLESLPPQGDYPLLQKALAALREKRGTVPYTALPDGPALKPGMTDPRVTILRTRLTEIGLQVPTAAEPPDLYDETLVAIVKAYQDGHGLTVDGVIGAKTVQSLNTTPDERIEQIVANLERRRWLPEDLGRRHVLVNAADYSMVFVDDGVRVFESLVIVGTRKDATPEIQSTMRGFQTNPYWTVPPSIAGEEYLPLLRRDPYALVSGGFRIFASWSDDIDLDPATVDWNSIHPKRFPYRIRQDPGPTNALGYIFFPFANKYGIYMHDTANRFLFTEGSRNFSHGCIRLKNPLDFVEKAFNGRNGFDKEKVRAAIKDGERRHYTFPEPITLHITYRTVTAGADGTPVFRDDIYGRDRLVVRAMAGPRS